MLYYTIRYYTYIYTRIIYIYIHMSLLLYAEQVLKFILVVASANWRFSLRCEDNETVSTTNWMFSCLAQIPLKHQYPPEIVQWIAMVYPHFKM